MAEDIDIVILNKALEYCIENNTLSFANLNDTYAYYINGRQVPQKTSFKKYNLWAGNIMNL
jgi:hypothetical protein